MKMHDEVIRLVPFEPSHWPYVYNWQHSGEYDYYFGNVDLLDSNSSVLSSLVDAKIFVIVKATDINQVIGICSLNAIKQRDRNCIYSILLDKVYQKTGLSGRVTRIVLDYAFNMMNLYKVIVTIFEENLDAIKSAEAFGFTKEADLVGESYFDGDFRDIKRFFLKKGTFNKLHRKKSEKEASASK